MQHIIRPAHTSPRELTSRVKGRHAQHPRHVLGAYAGLVLPVLAIGIALIWLPSSTALVLFSALELVLVAWAGRRTLASQAG